MTELWAAISEVLGVGYGERSGAVITKGETVMRARTTPSAGALYPFDVLVAFRGTTQYALYHYDVVGCCLRRLVSVGETDLTRGLLTQDDEQRPPAAVVAVVGRPGKSMLKYGRRGYLYTHLDGGHAATNIALAAADSGYRPVVHLRFDRHRAAEVFELRRLCAEPQALITFAEPTVLASRSGNPGQGHPANPFAMPIWRHDTSIMLEESGAEERAAWQTVSTVSTYHGDGAVPPRLGSTFSVTADGVTEQHDELRLPRPLAGDVPSFRTLALRRRSAKGFLPAAVDADTLGHTLAGLAVAMRVDCADGPMVGMRVLVRRVDDIASGTFAYAPDSHTLRPLGGDGGADDAIVAACMNQEVVRGIALLIALHAPVRPLLGERGRQGLAELHFHAACAAQQLCLGAAVHGLGITCLGGFDAGRIAELVRLEPSAEVIYVLAAGVPDETAVKWDRAPIVHSHGLAPHGTC